MAASKQPPSSQPLPARAALVKDDVGEKAIGKLLAGRRLSPAEARWADRQIMHLRSGSVDDADQARLASAGITAESETTREIRMRLEAETLLRELDWWVAKHGSARVPQSRTSRKVAGEPYPLGRRLALARAKYLRGSLDPMLAEELPRRPGWVWSVERAEWEDTAAGLELTLAEGRGPVTLGRREQQWLVRQRRFAQQSPSRLKPDQKKRIAAIDEALRARQPAGGSPAAALPRFLAGMRAWLAANPGLTAANLRFRDEVVLDGELYPVGRRATYYRRRYRQAPRGESVRQDPEAPLSEEEIAAITALPGWKWAPDQYRFHDNLDPVPRRARGSTG